MGTIRFELRKDANLKDKDGFAYIRLIYQLHGQRKFHSTKQKAPESNWDDESQRAVYTKPKSGGLLTELEVKKINRELDRLQHQVEDIEERFKANKETYSPQMVLDELTKKPATKRDPASNELYAFIDQYIADHANLRVKGSLTVYNSLKTHLEGFEAKTGNRATFDNINHAFFQGFQNYLVGLTHQVKVKDKNGKPTKEVRTEKRLNNITIAKQLSTLKTFLNYAKKQGKEVSNKYETFKIKRGDELEVIALTQDEFNLLREADFSKQPAWDRVRDAFILSCVTSYRYSDIAQLQWHHINFDGNYIQLTAVKTGHKNKVPLTAIARQILNKYKGQLRPIQVISNQKTNEHLTKICEWVGIKKDVEIVRKHGGERVVTIFPKYKLISFHCGRKTFATLSLEKKMPAEIVM
jgi:integrase